MNVSGDLNQAIILRNSVNRTAPRHKYDCSQISAMSQDPMIGGNMNKSMGFDTNVNSGLQVLATKTANW